MPSKKPPCCPNLRLAVFKMPRVALHLRQKSMRGPACAMLFFLIVLLLPSLRKSRKKRCTPSSTESYCPQPKQCVDSATDEIAPRALVVVAAGGQRAASTFLYNALRILMRIRDPNTVAGWYVDLKHLYMSYAQLMLRNGSEVTHIRDGNRVEAFQSVGSLLVKIHTVRDWHVFLGGDETEPEMENIVDAVYTSHRDIRDTVRSIRDMGWGVSHTSAQMEEEDFCRRKKRGQGQIRFFRKEDYVRGETWVTIAKAQVLCREALLETAGSKLKMDLKTEDVVEMGDSERIALLREMGRDLDYEYSDAELELAAKELKRLRPSNCDNGFDVEMSVNPVTHFHKGHVRKGDAQEAKSGMQAIQRDALCRQWLKQHMYHIDD